MGSTRDKVKRAVRKTVKWGGATLSLMLVTAWIATNWWNFGWQTTFGLDGRVGRGGLFVEWLDLANEPAVASMELFRHPRASLNWWFSWAFGAAGFQVSIPLWFPALLSLLATAAAWRADAKYLRRVREGACAACGYDRAGLAVGAVCPECGAAPSAG